MFGGLDGPLSVSRNKHGPIHATLSSVYRWYRGLLQIQTEISSASSSQTTRAGCIASERWHTGQQTPSDHQSREPQPEVNTQPGPGANLLLLSVEQQKGRGFNAQGESAGSFCVSRFSGFLPAYKYGSLRIFQMSCSVDPHTDCVYMTHEKVELLA